MVEGEPGDLVASKPIRVVIQPPPVEVEEPEEEEEQEWEGQLVDTPMLDDPERPEEADYLAEQDRTVEEETRTEEYRINPEVLATEYSEEDRVELEELVDVGATEHSTGAQVGNNTFDADRDGRLAALPSPYQLTNLQGLQRPTAASHTSETIAGAPNNDLLNEEIGRAVNLNTKEFLYANYINQIRRLVVFYWRQELDNLPRSVRISRPSYKTVVEIEIAEDGLLDSVTVADSSGSEPLDNAVTTAFTIAGPFPAPPEGLVDPDGRARLGNMGFTVEVGQARSSYSGVDPRGQVQFPGILKAPR